MKYDGSIRLENSISSDVKYGLLSTVGGLVLLANNAFAQTNKTPVVKQSADKPYSLSLSYGQTLGNATKNDKVVFPDNTSPDQPLGGEGTPVSFMDLILEKELSRGWGFRAGIGHGSGSSDWSSPSYGFPGMTGNAQFTEEVTALRARAGVSYGKTTGNGRWSAEAIADAVATVLESKLHGTGYVENGGYRGVGNSMDSSAKKTVLGIELGIVAGYRPVDWLEIFAEIDHQFGLNPDLEDGDVSTEVNLMVNGRPVHGEGRGKRSLTLEDTTTAKAGVRIKF